MKRLDNIYSSEAVDEQVSSLLEETAQAVEKQTSATNFEEELYADLDLFWLRRRAIKLARICKHLSYDGLEAACRDTYSNIKVKHAVRK